MRSLILLLIPAIIGCTNSNSIEGTYTLNKEKATRKLTSDPSYERDSDKKRMVRDIERGEFKIEVLSDSVRISTTSNLADPFWNVSTVKYSTINSGIQFTSDYQLHNFIKTDSGYVLIVALEEDGSRNQITSRNNGDIIEFDKIDSKVSIQSDASANPKEELAEQATNATELDFNNWDGTYNNTEMGAWITLEGEGKSLTAFDANNGSELEVEILPDGKVLINGAEAFLVSDTLKLVLNGSGGTHEVNYVRVMNDMN